MVSGLPTSNGDFAVTVTGTVNGCPVQASTSVPPPPPGQNVSVGNLALPAPDTSVVPTTTVTGTVLGTDGQGLAGVTVTISSYDLVDSAIAITGAGGLYTASAFPARNWPVDVEAAATVGGAMLYGAPATGGMLPVAGGTTTMATFMLQALPSTGPDPLTTVTGQVQNLDFSPAAGARVAIDLGYGLLITTTAADGTFTFSGVPTQSPSLQIVASSRQQCVRYFYFTGTPMGIGAVVPGGVTNVGTLTLSSLDKGPPACVTGTLSFGADQCLAGPVTVPLDLLHVDSAGNTTPAGTVTPDPVTGRFCVVLRREWAYLLRKQDFVCNSATFPCQTAIGLTDPGASGQCADAAPACQDLGAVSLTCFFGGS
jgi:hypothetical protein